MGFIEDENNLLFCTSFVHICGFHRHMCNVNAIPGCGWEKYKKHIL